MVYQLEISLCSNPSRSRNNKVLLGQVLRYRRVSWLPELVLAALIWLEGGRVQLGAYQCLHSERRRWQLKLCLSIDNAVQSLNLYAESQTHEDYF
ncbi:hypothetical protein BRADI_4g26173v3 [Brachypodium distachyon]|uniref:Uncharacterized protein n=1 Tax=Brachypodium distachyon TaxID=15368 RepID=A0A2K2CQD9_BRADI|nr:hypothetical protein BRADI_4g26173v3 [Brachypodium distachyon]